MFGVTLLLRPCMRFPSASALLLVLISVRALQAQQPPSTDSENPVFKTGTNLVLVPALVRTNKGELVYTLTANDFRLTDDGVEQKLTLDEDTGSQPLALVILAEIGAAGAHHLESYSKLGPMLDAIVGNVQHRIAVGGFDSQPNAVQDFTPDLEQVMGSLNNLRAGNDGDAIFDSLAFAVDMLRKQPANYRRAILLMSETIDHGSTIKLEDALRAISDTNTAIYSMGFSTTRAEMKYEASQFNDREHPGPAGGCMAREPKSDSEADDSDTETDTNHPKKQQNRAAQAYDCASLLAPPLRAAKMLAMMAMNGMHKNAPESVAQLTGGEYFRFENEKSFERELMTIANHIPNRYVLSVHPQMPHAGLHEIKLELRDYAKLQVTARRSYWVDEASK